ncbi:MAG: class II aldolase/adducin family protein [Verrucomicrobia bacterium]|nr:class II aldolase/adducin family protein [Verrucomicrobiota bacterium]
MSKSPEFEALNELSARLGANPAWVQGAGGNTSLKEDETLWIKASGLWLAQAQQQEIMVPVALDALLDALERADPLAEQAQHFVRGALNPLGLRPSIETTVHAVMPQQVVVHVHCVETIAVAVAAAAESLVHVRLAGFRHAFIPYVRPGLPLARAIAASLGEGTEVLVLGNHGLVVAAESVAGAELLLEQVTAALATPPRLAPPADVAALERLALDSSYQVPGDPALHALGTDPASCRVAAAGSLYPDHVIFLGNAIPIARPGETARDLAQAASPLLVFPGQGVLVARHASAGVLAMARCLADVASRIPPATALRVLTDSEQAELLGWDAEKYRKSLNAGNQEESP